MLFPIIMAGGTGSRLWPLSRESFPKQYLKLYGDMTMLQSTIARLNTLDCSTPLVICNEEHRFIVAEQLKKINKLDKNILLEPQGKNTAPAITLCAFAALKYAKNDEDPLLLVLAADHVIGNISSFTKSVKSALPHAHAGKLVTFGIIPTTPETGYGYIHRGEKFNDAYKVSSFTEKPDIYRAQEFLKTGEYYWNSGMFLFSAKRLLAEMEKYRPDIFSACEQAFLSPSNDLDFIRVDRDKFSLCPSESIDYAVMENTDDAIVVPMDAEWSDVGSWSSLWDISDKDVNGNAVSGDLISFNSYNNFIKAEDKLVALVGVNDLVLVHTDDAILVSSKYEVKNVKKIVEVLNQNGRDESKKHKEVYRPWGEYHYITEAEKYNVRRVLINPGQKISTQTHNHRSEHWVIVSGIAKITINNDINIIKENESIYIPPGTMHTIENSEMFPLEIIEIQTGQLLTEDDVIRP